MQADPEITMQHFIVISMVFCVFMSTFDDQSMSIRGRLGRQDKVPPRFSQTLPLKVFIHPTDCIPLFSRMASLRRQDTVDFETSIGQPQKEAY